MWYDAHYYVRTHPNKYWGDTVNWTNHVPFMKLTKYPVQLPVIFKIIENNQIYVAMHNYNIINIGLFSILQNIKTVKDDSRINHNFVVRTDKRAKSNIWISIHANLTILLDLDAFNVTTLITCQLCQPVDHFNMSSLPILLTCRPIQPVGHVNPSTCQLCQPVDPVNLSIFYN